MKKKNILIVLSIILAICIGIGAYQIFTPKKVESIPESTSAEITTVAGTTTKQEETTTENINNETTAKSGDNNDATTKKAESQSEKHIPSTAKSQATITTTTTTTTQKQSVNVKISITCKNIDKSDILSSTNITMSQGESVFDATKRVCNSKDISLTYQSVYYIQGIGDVMEKDYGASSGWMYRVNGIAPNKSAYSYTLKDGDVIEWYYITSPSDR